MDPLDIRKDLKELVDSNVDFLHFDVMDGLFVPRYGLYPEILKEIKTEVAQTGKYIPVDAHMMVANPEDYIDTFATAGADYYNVHYEACPNLHRTIKKIKDSGMKAGVALNYHTSPEVLHYLLPDIDMIVLMAINPGIVGHKIIPGIYQKILDTRIMFRDAGFKDILIQIDGGVTFESANKMMNNGADILVCGTGTIFRKHEDTITNQITKFRKLF
jgi:ribulose-phosphate 3-epimerase